MIELEGTGYHFPFVWAVNPSGEVTIFDAEGSRVIALNTKTKLPLDDELGLAEELEQAKAVVSYMCTAMNAHVGRAYAVKDGKLYVPRQNTKPSVDK